MERLPGFRDFYPEPLPSKEAWSADLRQRLFDSWRTTARRHGFREYDGPPLEPLELFTVKSGDEIVGQLYNFVDKGDREISLRPEMTPTLARMAAAAERQYKKPLKWFAIPQLFRYERQQKGRLREHFQFNADIIGEADPAADAELIALLINTLRELGLTDADFVVRLSSRLAWQEFYGERATEPGRSYEFFQIVDKLEREAPERSDAALQALGFSLEAVREFIAAARPTDDLKRILDDLGARGLGAFVKVDYLVIRGLAYYTGPVFEAFDRKGEFRAIAGGGRYDNLLKLISGGRVDLPALGFGMGDVVLTELLKARGLVPAVVAGIDVCVLVEDEGLRLASLRVVQQLRETGCAVDYSLTSMKPDKQFKRAVELGAAHTVRLVRGEDGAISARVKNLRTREEQVLSPDAVVPALSVRHPA
ncbi:MAG: ATP phosphoribosyltransferase regulatory subunit [Verrucomicrobiales bacterium]|nr:ATP phosphoribosyltransferase regulatory subunit [Verrucomicrobiales bacterium]